MNPIQHSLEINGVQLSYFEWLGTSEKVVLLCHATGFHARCWDAVIRYLPPDVRVLALEHRGHGRSEKCGPYAWQQFGDDLLEFINVLDLQRVIGVGHSMGGFTSLYAASFNLQRFEQLLLLDPVIMSSDFYVDQTSANRYRNVEDHPISRRVNHWGSAQAMFEKFAARYPFSLWREDVLQDYCQHGLEQIATKARSGDGFQLCCPPRVEAAIYMANAGFNPHLLFDKLKLPVTVLRAETKPENSTQLDFSKSPTWPALANHLPNAHDIYLPFLSHFLPMQDPFLIATHINQMIV